MPAATPDPPASRFQSFIDKTVAATGMPVAAVMQMLGRQRPSYSYAESRLTHGPMLFAQDPAQAKALMGEQNYGQYFPTINPANVSPLSNVVRRSIYDKGAPVVVAPYEAPVAGPAGKPGTEHGVPLHESVHQFLQGARVSPQSLYAQTDKIDPSIKQRIHIQLTNMNYPTSEFGDELASRLAAGQFQSLGLSPQEGEQVWRQWLSEMAKTDPKKAQRLDLYTRANHAAILQQGEPTAEQTAAFMPSPAPAQQR